MNRNHLRRVDDDGLQTLVERLQRNQLDFQQRLAERLASVRDPDVPRSDPLYQRLFHILDKLKVQRSVAERELSRRAAPA